MSKLSGQQIEGYFQHQIPYRVGILLAHYKMTHDRNGNNKSWTGSPGPLNACFVASLVTARAFLNLLGIGKKSGVLCVFEPKSNDITAADLGGTCIDLATLSQNQKKLLLDFLKMADQAAAHFTTPQVHDWARTHEVITLVHGYVKAHLYDATGRTGLEAL